MTGTPLYSTTSPSFTIVAGAKKTITYNLPVFNNTPGVYAGEMVLVDQNGVVHSPELDFRYIVAGDIATLQSINTGSGAVAKSGAVKVTVIYSGTPLDISNVKSSDVGPANLSVTLYNEKNELVGQSNSSINITQVSAQIVSINALVDARALRADATITKDSKTLSKLSTSFSPALSTLPPVSTDNSQTSLPDLNTIILSGLGFLAIVLIFWLIFRKHNKKTLPNLPVVADKSVSPQIPINKTSVTPVAPSVTPTQPVAPKPPISPIPPVTMIALLILGGLMAYSFSRVFAYTQVNNAPIITGPTDVYTYDINAFTVTYPTTTPQIRYGLSFNGNGGTPNQYIPATGGVSGSASTTIFHQWRAPGNNQLIGVKAFAVNPNGSLGVSTPWQIFSVNVTNNPVSAGPGGWVLTSYSDQKNLSPADISLAMMPSAGPFSQGSSFQMQFAVQAIQCGNSNQNVSLNIQSFVSSSTGSTVAGFTPKIVNVNNGKAQGCTNAECLVANNTTLSSGYFSIPATTPPGTYRISFEIKATYGNTVHATVDGYKDIVVSANPVGILNSTSSCTAGIIGFACDADSPSTPLTVSLYEDTPAGGADVGFIGKYIANVTQSTIGGWCNGTTNHGFVIPVPDSFKDNTNHLAYVYATNINSSGQPYSGSYNPLVNGFPITLNCAAATNSCSATVPSTPTGLTSTSLACYVSPSSSETHLVWNTVSGATGYKVSRSTSLNGSYADITSSGSFDNSLGGSQTGFYDSSGQLSDGTTYYYEVLASNCAGNSSPSSAVPATGSSVCSVSCPSGQQNINGVCIIPGGSCTAPQVSNGAGGCKCPTPGQVFSNGSCVTPSSISCSAVSATSSAPITSAKVGDRVVWEITGTPGVPDGSYYWDDGSGVVNQTQSPSYSVNYSTVGNKIMSVSFSVNQATKVYVCSTSVGQNYLPVYGSQMFKPI